MVRSTMRIVGLSKMQNAQLFWKIMDYGLFASPIMKSAEIFVAYANILKLR